MHVVVKPLLLCLIGMVALRPLNAATVTLAPAAGVTTNVLHLFTGDTAVDVAGPGTVLLNPANSHTGGTTLSGGTLQVSGNVALGSYSPVGAAGTFTVAGGTLRGSGTFARNIKGTAAAAIEAPNGWAWTGNNSFSYAVTVAGSPLEIASGETDFGGGLTVADGASISVTGGTLGINTASGAGNGAISINGGTIKNISSIKGSGNNWFDWLKSTVSVSIGAEGAVFKGGGNTAFYAQISTPLTSSAAPGETAAGITFDGGNWGYYAEMAHAGPTIIKNGATVFISGSGYIPSSSAVTVGSGSQLRLGYRDRTISSLTLEEGAILGFASETHILTVDGPVTLPAAAQIALYANNNPKTAAKNTDGTYNVLTVPAAYAEALRTVRWTCATSTSGKAYTFSVTTSGTTATLAMTIADAPADGADITVAAGETLAVAGAVSVGSGSITVNGTMIVPGTLDGTAAGGTVTVNDGGVLDVTGNIRISNVADGRFDLYVNDGGTLRAREINITSSLEATAANSIHFDGATVRPIASLGDDNFRYFPRYATVYIGAKGVTFDFSDWDADGQTGWYRFSCQGHMDTDPALNGAPDGGITVRGTRDGKAVFYLGAGLNGATLNGGITVEAGGKISAGQQALSDDSVTLLPGSVFKSYDKETTSAIQSLTMGAANGTEPVALQPGTFAIGPALVVEELSVLSPVEFSTAGYASGKGVWNYNAAANPGVYTALVYRAVSPALDTSLFRVPAKYASDYSLSAETVALTEGTYAGYTALVLTVATAAHDDLVLKENDAVTISSDAEYGDIYVGDLGVVGAPVLTLNSGNVKASTFYLAYQPADGASSSERHTVSYIQNGGSLTVNNIYSMYRGSDAQSGRVYAEITVNGGTFTCTGDALLGYNRTRSGYTTTLTVNEGAAVTIGGKLTLIYYNSSSTSDSYSAPQGIIRMNGGTLDVAGDIDLSRRKNYSSYAVDGGIFLRGGVLSARNIIQTIGETPVQRFVFDGGVYAPNAAAAGRTMSGLTTAHVSTNGAIVSTEKLPAGATYTIAQNLLTDPALNGAADGGFTKRGAGTLALSGANTFTGPTRVEGGLLSITGGDAVSSDIAVSDGAALDLGGADVAVDSITASGAVGNGSLTVGSAFVLASGGSLLAVDGDLSFAPGAAVDFAALGANADARVWTPVAAVSGTASVPPMLRARNAGNCTRCETMVVDGVVYVCPTVIGLVISIH